MAGTPRSPKHLHNDIILPTARTKMIPCRSLVTSLQSSCVTLWRMPCQGMILSRPLLCPSVIIQLKSINLLPYTSLPTIRKTRFDPRTGKRRPVHAALSALNSKPQSTAHIYCVFPCMLESIYEDSHVFVPHGSATISQTNKATR